MVELKEKTVEELRKMASRKKIEGRSKMNKSQLVNALKKKIMKGGALTQKQKNILLNRNFTSNPLYLDDFSSRRYGSITNIVVPPDLYDYFSISYIDTQYGLKKFYYHFSQLSLSNDNNSLIIQNSNRVNINYPNPTYPTKVSTHNDGQCSICMENTGLIGNVSQNRKSKIVKLKYCGHVFHKNCLEKYMDNEIEKSAREDRERQFLCPLCREHFNP